MNDTTKYDLEAIAAELTDENLKTTENMLWVPRLFQIGAVIVAIIMLAIKIPEMQSPTNFGAAEFQLAVAVGMSLVVFIIGSAAIRGTKKRLNIIRKHKIS